MAYQVGSACYGTQQQAASAAASVDLGRIVLRAGDSYTADVLSTSDTLVSWRFKSTTDGHYEYSYAPYTAQPCGLLGVSDGIAIGWMIAAAWIGTYCLLFLARTLRGESESSYGNS